MVENMELNNSKCRQFSCIDDDSFRLWTFRLWFFKLWYWLNLINISSELHIFAMILALTTREMNYNKLLSFKDKTKIKYELEQLNLFLTIYFPFTRKHSFSSCSSINISLKNDLWKVKAGSYWNSDVEKDYLISLTHFMPLISFYTHWKHEKTYGYWWF